VCLNKHEVAGVQMRVIDTDQRDVHYPQTATYAVSGHVCDCQVGEVIRARKLNLVGASDKSKMVL